MNMKLFKIYIISLVTMAMIVACTDEWDLQKNNFIREGVPVTVSLDFGVSASKIASRAAESETTERTVNRVYLFVFNSDGSLDNKQLFTINSSTESCITSVTSFPMHSGYDKRFYAIANPTSGSGTLGANDLATIESEEELLKQTSSLLNPTNIERSYFLMSGKMESASGSTQIDVYEDGTIQGAETCRDGQPVIELERVDARITFKIKGVTDNPYYTDFTFVPDRYWVENIPQHSYVFPHDEDYVDINPGAINYVSMSDEAYNIQRNVEGQDEDEYYYFEFYIAENRLKPDNPIKEGDADSENAESLYALREKKEKTPLAGDDETDKTGQTEKNGAFKYAPIYSTHVVFHGTLSYTDTSGSIPQFVYADATYTVHLGATGNSTENGSNWANDVSLVNNYNTERNTHYTYTIEVQGVSSMVVEVEEDKEDRPGTEGDVIFSGEAVEEMDAHYGRTRFTLTRGNIKDGLSWAIRTPFQSGMKPFEASNFNTELDSEGNITTVLTKESDYSEEEWKQLQTDLSLNDYKWVQFLINKEAGFENDDFAKYPGYASYVGKGYENTIINVAAPPFGGTGAVPPSSNSHYRGETIVLYDVNQLLNHLYAEAYKPYDPETSIFNGSGDDATVTITAFVDEYVYVYDPTKIYYRSPEAVVDSNVDGIDLTLWKRAVNRDSRMLYLCTTGAIYSPDGETSVSRNVFTIAQKPVYTFFNENDTKVTKAWGIESINETGPVSPKPKKGEVYGARYTNGSHNGLPNTRNVLYNRQNNFRDLKWSDIMYLDDNRENNNGTLKLYENYNTIWYACIARNRDLNGDDIINENEVRWYLASIDQLTDIWIGQWSLNESSWLYHGDGSVCSHVASSTYTLNEERGEYANPYVIWAEEGASRGQLDGGSSNYNGKGTNGNSSGYIDADKYGNNERYHYRCVRNLGISLEENYPDVPSYVNVSTDASYTNQDGETYREIVLDLEGMESNSIRSAIVQDAELPAHNERNYTNRPYRKFAVIKERDFWLNWRSGNKAEWDVGTWTDYESVDICPEGYRMPNQRELMLMYINIPNNQDTGMIWYDPSGNNSPDAIEDKNEYWDDVRGKQKYDKYTNRHYVCRTSFGYDDLFNGDRPGFMYSIWSGLLYLETGVGSNANHTDGFVRCVRDVAE